jgi:hypothetical protein
LGCNSSNIATHLSSYLYFFLKIVAIVCHKNAPAMRNTTDIV